MSDAAERLKWLCSPDAERLSDYERINQIVKAGIDVTNEIVRLRSAIEAIKQATIEGLSVTMSLSSIASPRCTTSAIRH
jgi:hypothetical protein